MAGWAEQQRAHPRRTCAGEVYDAARRYEWRLRNRSMSLSTSSASLYLSRTHCHNHTRVENLSRLSQSCA